MRLRHIALGCTLTGALGCLVLPPATARAAEGALDKATLTMTAPAVVVYGANVPLSGRLRIGADAPPAQTPVTVTRTGTGTKRTFLERTGAGGSFTFTDRDPAKGHYTYTASFAGDQTAAAAAAAAGVTVERVKPALAISTPTAGYHYGATARFTITLGPTFADRKVALYASPYGQARRLVAAASVNAQGKWYPAYKITKATSFTVVYAGDAHNSASSAGLTLQAYAQVTDRIGGYFKTVRVGHLSYAVYHGSGTLTLYSTVTPPKHGECLEPESEQLNGSTWGADTKYGCDKLNAASHDAAPFSLNEAVGDRYRIRGDYLRSAKDRANLDAQGPWLYFEVVS